MHVDDSCPFPSIPKLASQLCMYSAAQRAIDAYIPETTPRNSSPSGFPLAAISRPTKPRTTTSSSSSRAAVRQGEVCVCLFVCSFVIKQTTLALPCISSMLCSLVTGSGFLLFDSLRILVNPAAQMWHLTRLGIGPRDSFFVCLFVCLFPFLSRLECPGPAGRTLAREQASRRLRGGPSSGQAGWLAGWLGGGRAGLQDHAKRPSAKDGFVSLESNNVLF